MSDVCVFCLIENGRVSITAAAVHVDDNFAVELKKIWDILCDDLNRQILQSKP